MPTLEPIWIAGAQEKTALLRKDGRWFTPAGATATTHILKPQIGTLPNGVDLPPRSRTSAAVARWWSNDAVRQKLERADTVMAETATCVGATKRN